MLWITNKLLLVRCVQIMCFNVRKNLVNKRKKIAFYSPHLSERGTETAMYDFAYYNETILGNESIIIYDPNCHNNHPSAIEKFKKRFDVFEVNGPNFEFGWNSQIVVPLIDTILLKENCDILYMQKGGRNDGVYSRVCKNIILCCGGHYEPHGEVYAYVSNG